MLPMGHIGLTFVIARGIEKIFKLTWLDYRILLVAALLPDLIDKPLRYLLLYYPSLNNRSYGHSVWLLLLLIIGSFLQIAYRHNFKTGILFIGAFIHDILDAVSHHGEWSEKMFDGYPLLLVIEMLGGSILMCLFIGIVTGNNIVHFLQTGSLQKKRKLVR